MGKRLTTEEFIEKVKIVHKNKYNYSITDYMKSKTKVLIICPTHGKFSQRPNDHLKGQGCPCCSSNKKLTTREFIERVTKIHKDTYDYSLANYKKSQEKIIIKCPKHGKFKQKPNDHLNGQGCKKCGHKVPTTKEFIKKSKNIHGNKYNYSKIFYKNSFTKVIIICKKHGKFLQTPHNHLSGNGCPKCTYKISKNQIKWLEKMEKENNLKLEKEFLLQINGHKFFIDGFDLKTNTCYEYNGYFWHGHPDYYDQNDINPRTKTTFGELYKKTLEKEKLIKSAGYNLITKWGK